MYEKLGHYLIMTDEKLKTGALCTRGVIVCGVLVGGVFAAAFWRDTMFLKCTQNMFTPDLLIKIFNLKRYLIFVIIFKSLKVFLNEKKLLIIVLILIYFLFY